MLWLITCAYLYHWQHRPLKCHRQSAMKIEDPSILCIPDYVKLSYPMGDVPKETGVCTDVVIRTFLCWNRLTTARPETSLPSQSLSNIKKSTPTLTIVEFLIWVPSSNTMVPLSDSKSSRLFTR